MNRKDSKVKEIFCAALEKKTAAERSAYLDGACMGNDKLRGQVEALLKAHDAAGNKFLKEPAGVDITLDDSALRRRSCWASLKMRLKKKWK